MTSDLYCMHKSGHLEKEKKNTVSVNDFPDERQKNKFSNCKISDQKKTPQGCSAKTYIFPLLVVQVITRRQCGGGGL